MNNDKTLAALLLAMSTLGCTSVVTAETGLAPVTHGVAVGDVSDDSAVIWSRTDRYATLHVALSATGEPGWLTRSVEVEPGHDYTGKVAFNQLKPDTDYRYRVWFTTDDATAEGRKAPVSGTFHTAPKAHTPAAVTLAWGGDVSGQNVCRDVEEGFPVFKAINAMKPDLFVGLGDMIYADGVCEAVGRYGNTQIPGDFTPAADMANYWAHWKYNRADDTYQALLAQTPYYAIWDDHETVNDFGPLHDTRDTAPYTPGVHLLPLGRAAFLDYNPIAENPATPDRLYRSIRWGKHLELFILDTRQYRDANLTEDNADLPKTMLGREQLVWLKEQLKASDATWKVIVSSVPMSIPTGYPPEFGRDGWGNFDQNTGFEYELLDILRFMQQEGMYNTAWITTDVHFAEVFRYTPFGDAPDFQVHEFVSGPVNAGLFPNRDFDATLGTESLFFYGPDDSANVTTYAQAKPWLNFGAMSIDQNGVLNVSIRDVNGQAVYQTTLTPR